jgi:hypothetical protein
MGLDRWIGGAGFCNCIWNVRDHYRERDRRQNGPRIRGSGLNYEVQTVYDRTRTFELVEGTTVVILLRLLQQNGRFGHCKSWS